MTWEGIKSAPLPAGDYATRGDSERPLEVEALLSLPLGDRSGQSGPGEVRARLTADLRDGWLPAADLTAGRHAPCLPAESRLRGPSHGRAALTVRPSRASRAAAASEALRGGALPARWALSGDPSEDLPEGAAGTDGDLPLSAGTRNGAVTEPPGRTGNADHPGRASALRSRPDLLSSDHPEAGPGSHGLRPGRPDPRAGARSGSDPAASGRRLPSRRSRAALQGARRGGGFLSHLWLRDPAPAGADASAVGQRRPGRFADAVAGRSE